MQLKDNKAWQKTVGLTPSKTVAPKEQSRFIDVLVNAICQTNEHCSAYTFGYIFYWKEIIIVAFSVKI